MSDDGRMGEPGELLSRSERSTVELLSRSEKSTVELLSRSERSTVVSRGRHLANAAAALLMAVVCVVAVVAVLRVDNWGEAGGGRSERFALDVDQVRAVAPELIGYDEIGRISAPMQAVRAIAVAADDRILVAGDRAVQVFLPDGTPQASLVLPDEPTSLTVAGQEDSYPGRIYVGLGSRLAVYEATGEAVGTWSAGLNEDSLLTSLAVFEDTVVAADAGNRVVVRWDAEGSLVGRIGEPDPSRNLRGFVLPSPYFDVAIPRDGVLRVCNPGARRIEAFTLDGDLLGVWGQASPHIEGFFGCCNPSHFAMLADGRFVTSEKGIPRVKIYSPQGDFQCVVAAPQQLVPGHSTSLDSRDEHGPSVFDVAADSAGRVLVLDPQQRAVRIFQPKGASPHDLPAS